MYNLMSYKLVNELVLKFIKVLCI